jgi:hypothetical protein
MKITRPENAIVCQLESGPIFGGHKELNFLADLKIADQCNLNQESLAGFPSSYTNERFCR